MGPLCGCMPYTSGSDIYNIMHKYADVSCVGYMDSYIYFRYMLHTNEWVARALSLVAIARPCHSQTHAHTHTAGAHLSVRGLVCAV